MSFDHKPFLKTLTGRPGVYCMQDEEGKVIYVGKAKNLKNRVTSYFNKSQTNSPKTMVMVKQIENIEVTVTHTENEALILENNLIKSYKPRYNILFRDDKSYPYLYLSTDHDYPHFRYHRGALKGKGKFFGPYPSAGSVRSTLNVIQKLFLIRSCEDSVFANRSRPCLQYQIKRCTAPCVEAITKEDYQRDIEHAKLFLEGKNEDVIKGLTEPMQKASDALEFEIAARFRDQIRSLRDVQEKQHITTDGGDIDIIACVINANQACIQLVFIRAGLNLGNRNYYPQHIEEQSEADLVKAFISQFYLNENKQQKIPTEILISHDFEDSGLIENIISEKAGKKIKLKTNVRAERAKWLAMAKENAEITLKQKIASNKSQHKRFEALQKLLSFKEPIEHMECFDISHTQGESTVGSCVVFGPDGPVNSKYRLFNIENITKGDDYAAMSQVIRRRYTRLVKENASLPDLIIIDGGKGQIGVAKKELYELQLTHIPILGVAKGPSRKPGLENLILALENKTVDCDSSSPALHLIQHIRDESHRFAITAHRQRRKKTRGRSKLEDIEGIGNKRRQSIIKHFGGIQGVAKAGVDDIAMVSGINKSLAQKVYDVFHNN
ncbi:MAG TPA: excinuclease ABC subunit UvrC [Thiotrichaceae bacterium]|jgi:excinuclease ABC subunit C|nr:excinuclease ABC subunit UvrC [Thiotrichaceae bacterium]HIM07095.1 excinuclease ABC subunit UvrC [Gammaproteobacteria bacterium]